MIEWCATASRSGMDPRLLAVMAKTAHMSGSTFHAFVLSEKLFLKEPGIAKFADSKRSRLYKLHGRIIVFPSPA